MKNLVLDLTECKTEEERKKLLELAECLSGSRTIKPSLLSSFYLSGHNDKPANPKYDDYGIFIGLYPRNENYLLSEFVLQYRTGIGFNDTFLEAPIMHHIKPTEFSGSENVDKISLPLDTLSVCPFLAMKYGVSVFTDEESFPIMIFQANKVHKGVRFRGEDRQGYNVRSSVDCRFLLDFSSLPKGAKVVEV